MKQDNSAGVKMAKTSLAKVQDYKTVFDSPVGKKVLYDLMKQNFISDTFATTDPQEMAIKEGQRRVVLRILNILKTDQSKLIDQIREGERNG